MLLDAIAAGKDVYCEKGWTTSVAAAKRMRKAVKEDAVQRGRGLHRDRHAADVDGGFKQQRQVRWDRVREEIV